MHICVKVLDVLELELKADMSYVWVLGTEQGFSVKAASDLSH